MADRDKKQATGQCMEIGMRSYIRHPSDIPIEYLVDGDTEEVGQEYLKDIGHGGLSFVSSERLQPGRVINVRIPHVQPEFNARAQVAWCRPKADGYVIGVAFVEISDLYRARMVEQVCHIEHYKNEVLFTEGRELSGEQAAREWIAKFAGLFPQWLEEKAS